MANVSPRKMPKGKRVLPTLPPESPRLKLVTFNDDVTETSIGGTRTVGKIKKDVILHFEPKSQNQNAKYRGVSSRSSSRTGDSSSDTTKVSSKPPQPKVSVSAENNNSKVTVASDKTFKVPITGSTSSGSESDTVAITNIDNDIDHSSQDCNNLNDIPDTPTNLFRTPIASNDHQPRRHTLESKLFGTPDCYRNVNLGTPRRMLPLVQDESMVDEGEDSCSIMVAVRVRPFAQRELADSSNHCAVSMEGNQTVVRIDNGPVHRFAYDFSFWSQDKSGGEFSGQETVYKKLAQPMLGKAFEGYNTCLFAYGQTGSGKSYSIMGHGKELGIIPRFCAELFQRAETLKDRHKVKVNVEISFYEIYNEKIHDLLAATTAKEKGAKKPSLKVREHPQLGPYVEGLSNYVVNSFDDVEGWINLGNKNRATATTAMNDKSSRSHSILTVILTQTKTESIEGHEHDHSITSKINLVDLAGSERQSFANTTGERLREGANINKSLLTLGKVISLLSEKSVSSKKRKLFIPYRDSVLTWLLKESLGGNSKTAMLATISPSSIHMDETLSTLRYAQQARSIVNMVRVNEDPKARIIRQLKSEIEKLRTEQGGGAMNEEALALSMAEVSRLKSEMEELSRSWQERLRQAEARKAEELQLLEHAGVSFKVDNRLPNLVNLNEDPQLSEMLLYVIKEGKTRVGRKLHSSHHDIQLTGALIADYHCVIQNEGGQVNITPIKDAPTYVNGNLVSACTILHHGDRVILGGDHFFRFNHPIEVKKNKTNGKGSNPEIKDFDYAKQELHSVQEERLQAEVEREVERTRQELSQQKDGYETKLKGLEEVLTNVEQTQKEAQSTIHSLKKKNMMLEQEVLAGRKRQQMESTVYQQALDELPNRKSRIVELLESERRQMKEHLESHRVKRSQLTSTQEMTCSSNNLSPMVNGIGLQTKVTSSPSGGRDLYRMALLLREANKINQYLNSNLVFCREDTTDEDNAGGERGVSRTQIRVVNTRHKMTTLWSVARFEDKLEQMRDIYNNEGDVSADDDDVFNDPDDVWEKDTSMVMSSPALSNSLNGVWKSPAWIKRGTPTPFLNGTRRGTLGLCGDSPSPRESHQGLLNMFRSIFSITEDVFSELSLKESIADKILVVCQRITDNTKAVMRHSSSCNTGPSDGDNHHQHTRWLVPIFQLATDVQTLTSLTSSLCSSLSLSSSNSSSPSSSEGGFLMDLMGRLKEAVKTIHHKGNCLLQGCEGRITSLVCESSQKMEDAVISLVETIGEMSLGLGLHLVRLDGTHDDQLSGSIKLAFLQGSCKFVLHSQDGARVSLQSLEANCDRLKEAAIAHSDTSSGEMFKRIGHILNCTKCFLEKTSNVQRQIEEYHHHHHHQTINKHRGSIDDDASEEEEEEDDDEEEEENGLAAYHYNVMYKQLQGVVSQASTIADSCTLLVQMAQSVVLGTANDGKRLEKCTRLVLSGCQRLLAISTSQSPFGVSSSSSSSSSSTLILSQSSSLLLSSLMTTTMESPHNLHNENIDSHNIPSDSLVKSSIIAEGDDGTATTPSSSMMSDLPSTFTSISSLSSYSNETITSTTASSSLLSNNTDTNNTDKHDTDYNAYNRNNSNSSTHNNDDADTLTPGLSDNHQVAISQIDRRTTTNTTGNSKGKIVCPELSDIVTTLQTRMQSLADTNQEVTMATVMFVEFLQKYFGSGSSSSSNSNSDSSSSVKNGEINKSAKVDKFSELRGISTTPRGQRMLPASPKHKIITMAGKEAILKKRERIAGLALAELGSKKKTAEEEEEEDRTIGESTIGMNKDM